MILEMHGADSDWTYPVMVPSLRPMPLGCASKFVVSMASKTLALVLLWGSAGGCRGSPGVPEVDGTGGGDLAAGDEDPAPGDGASAPGDDHHGSGEVISGTHAGRSYELFVPAQAGLGSPLPLLVMLHGCDQDPEDFAAGTQMNALAAAEGAFVLYPEQPTSANFQRCWNWFLPANQARDMGEPALVAGMVEQVRGAYSIDAGRIWAAGFSSGAAMTVVLGATYPDIFAALGVVAGLEFAAATNVMEAATAMAAGGPPATTQGQVAFAAMGPRARIVPAIVLHGAADPIVKPINGDQVVSQWAQTNDLAADGVDDDNIDDIADATESQTTGAGVAYTITRYDDSDDERPVVEKVIIAGAGHAWPGGSPAGSYTDPDGPDATALIWDFLNAASP